jgi:hypothetical protein
MKKLLFVALAATIVSGAYAGQSAGFQLSLVPDVAIQDRDTEINGVSLGIWNENPSPKFQWQLGFINGSTGESVGVKWFIFLPTIYNYAETYTGLSWGFANYASGDFTGAQWGAVNITSGDFVGVQWGFVNVTAGNFTGFQWGAVNYVKDLTGLQLGAVNWAQHSTSGIQIGFINIIPENEWFADGDLAQGMVFVNWGF